MSQHRAPADSAIVFGEFPSAAALGVMLGHTLTVGAHKLKKGRRLSAEDIELLLQAGIETISGARLGDGDLDENAAAAAVTALLAGANTQTRQPYSGRCNLHATVNGVVTIDADSIIRANRLGEAIAIGTLPPWSVVRKGQVIATVKIIPFGVHRSIMEACSQALARPPLRVAELRPQRAALLVTELPGVKEKALTATISVTRQRLETLGSRLALELRCRHETTAIAAALHQAHAAGCELILISGATGTKDRNDIAPAAIVAAGGSIERFGMPVEPGNMLLLAHLQEIPVLVMPGCARSRRLNGLDWVLQRLLARLPLDDDDFAAMGVGGLIRHTPGLMSAEAEAGEASDESDAADALDASETAPPVSAGATRQTSHGRPGKPRIAALVLAAGQSRRMGNNHKLLERLDGVPLIQRAVNAALASCADSVTVVTGHSAEEITALIRGPRVAIVHNAEFADGMASSLRRGIAALPKDCDGVLVMLGDMPRISAAHLDRLIEAFNKTDQAAPAIVAPVHGDRRGNPVVWPRRYFAEIMAIEGDQGARTLLSRHADAVITVEMSDSAIFIDVDTPQDLANLSAGNSTAAP